MRTTNQPDEQEEPAAAFVITMLAVHATLAFTVLSWIGLALLFTTLVLLGGGVTERDWALIIGAWVYPILPVSNALLSVSLYRQRRYGATTFSLAFQFLLTLPMLLLVLRTFASQR